MRKLLILLTFLILLSSIVHAKNTPEDVTITVRSLDTVIPAGGDAVFEIILTNHQSANDKFAIKANDLSLYPFSDFAADLRTELPTLEAPRGKTVSMLVYVKTLSSATEGKTYELPIEIQSTLDDNILIKESLYVRVLPANQLITIQTALPADIKPGKKTPFVLTFINKGNIVVDNAEVYITSPVYTDSRILTFKPGIDVEETFNLQVDEDTAPETYPLTIRIYQHDEIKGVYTTEITVGENEKLLETKDTEERFLKKTITLTYDNKGNYPVEKKVIYPIQGFQRFFTSTEPSATYDTGNYYWQFTVNRGKSIILTITTNYFTPLLIFILIILIGYVSWYFYNKRLHINKRVFKIKHDVEEGMSEMKIVVHVKNKTGTTLNNARLIDLVPSYVILSKDYPTLKPDHIQQGSSGGLRLIWDIGTLAPAEERIISYKIKTKLGDMIKIHLPGCNAQHIDSTGAVVHIRGNSLTLTP